MTANLRRRQRFGRFKSVLGFPGYMVSTLGDVRETKYPLRALRQHKTPYGTQRVRMMDDQGHWKQVAVCKIVAEAFVYNPVGFKVIVFVDGNKLNCAENNLLWAASGKVTYVT